MTLDQQDAVAAAIAHSFGMDPSKAIKDLRVHHHSGYRAVHIHLKLRRAMAEVQVRTELQSKWANTYERLGDIVGRGIRYSSVDQTTISDATDPTWIAIATRLQEISTGHIRVIEERKNTIAQMLPEAGYVWQSLDDLPEHVRRIGESVLEGEAQLSIMLDDIERTLRG
ncbi:hypothetical protein ACFWPA_17120 [Rhodococcus sp. NPDC058505]|uniref:hypothetical protein n=1 Tax=unclassified Rhodococcus (in: high G+C Gram-positive bacteria) TaxID=192944 RepID=UPI00365B1705